MNPQPLSVITSKKAAQNLLEIKSRHADIVTGMANQKIKVDAYNQQKDAERAEAAQNQQIMANEMKQAEMTNNTTVQKNAMDFSIKQNELELKRIALSQP